MVSTKPPDLPLFFDDMPRGIPTNASTRQAVGNAKRRWNSIKYQRAATGLDRCAWVSSACVLNKLTGRDSSGLASVEGSSIGISVCSKVEI